MDLVTTRDALRLTGLSADQLREWTIRRRIIPPDVKPKGQGSSAKFSWQTVLLLRLASVLRDRFSIELQAYQQVFGDLGQELKHSSFISLWEKSVVIWGAAEWKLSSMAELPETFDGLIILRLDPHLKFLATELAPDMMSMEQLPLFMPMSVGKRT